MEVLSVCAAGMQPRFEDGLQGQEVVTHSLQVNGRAQEPGVLCRGRPTVTRWMLLRQFTAAGTTSVKEEALRARQDPRLFRALKGGSPQQHLRLELSRQPVQLPQDRTGSLPGGHSAVLLLNSGLPVLSGAPSGRAHRQGIAVV